MNSFVLLSAVLLICHVLVDGRSADNYKSNKMKVFLEGGLRDMMKTGNEKLGIPILDPFFSEQLPIEFEEPGMVVVDALLSKVDVKDLSSYVVNDGNFQLIGLKMMADLTWPKITASLGYTGKGNIGGSLDVFGTGTIDVTVKGLRVSVEMSLKMANKRLQVKSMNIKVNLEDLDFKITGLYNDEEMSALFSKIISEMTPQLVADYPDLISKTLNEVATEMGNEKLKDMTIKDIRDLIKI